MTLLIHLYTPLDVIWCSHLVCAGVMAGHLKSSENSKRGRQNRSRSWKYSPTYKNKLTNEWVNKLRTFWRPHTATYEALAKWKSSVQKFICRQRHIEFVNTWGILVEGISGAAGGSYHSFLSLPTAISIHSNSAAGSKTLQFFGNRYWENEKDNNNRNAHWYLVPRLRLQISSLIS